MDPDTSQKVTDLLNIMEDMSSDIDTQGELGQLQAQMREMQDQLIELTRRFDSFEQTYIDRKKAVLEIKKELEELLEN